MVALIVGILCIAFTVFSVLPSGLDWGQYALAFLKGGLPFITGLVGIIALFIGIADFRDKLETKKAESVGEKK